MRLTVKKKCPTGNPSLKPVVKTEMGREDASLIYFGECARDEKNILNDRGVVKK